MGSGFTGVLLSSIHQRDLGHPTTFLLRLKQPEVKTTTSKHTKNEVRPLNIALYPDTIYGHGLKLIYACACICIGMTKVISLSDEAYAALKRIKREGESFSDVVLRLVGQVKYRPLSEFAGRWAGDDIDDVFDIILREREKAESREASI